MSVEATGGKLLCERWSIIFSLGGPFPVMSRFQLAFGALILVQAAHSIEEYVGHLWESFPPARFVTGLVSSDLEHGFVILNVSLLAFGAWCFLWPVRRGWSLAVPLAWVWAVLEIVNGIGHPLWSLREGGYTPGLATALVLLILAVYLAYELRRANTPSIATRSSSAASDPWNQ